MHYLFYIKTGLFRLLSCLDVIVDVFGSVQTCTCLFNLRVTQMRCLYLCCGIASANFCTAAAAQAECFAWQAVARRSFVALILHIRFNCSCCDCAATMNAVLPCMQDGMSNNKLAMAQSHSSCAAWPSRCMFSTAAFAGCTCHAPC